MPVSAQLKCIFVHVPKTGGTSVEVALDMFGDWRIENTRKMFGLIQSSELKKKIVTTNFLQHLTADELRELLPNDFSAWYRFAFVRNPWDRMVSIFSKKDPDMVMTARAQGIELSQLSFSDFLDRSDDLRHVHLRPQSEFVFDRAGDCLANFVGRYERIAEDFQLVCEQLKISRSLPHRNASAREDYRKYYDDESRRKVERRYARDIELFSYVF